ncbi:VOC family protein [Candidatus Omnitrophota bacterium]
MKRNRIKAIRHTGIVVSNLKKALYFYRDLLGLKVIKRMCESGDYIDNILTLKDVKVTTVKMAAEDGNLIELLFFHSHPRNISNRKKIYDIGISHVAFTVNNLDAEYKRLSELGIQFNLLPQISPDGYAKVAFCVDPDRNSIELVEVL